MAENGKANEMDSVELTVSMLKPVILSAYKKGVVGLLRGLKDTSHAEHIFAAVAALGDLGPGAVETAFQKFGDKYFESEVWSDFWRSAAVRTTEAALEVSREIDGGGKVTVEEAKKRIHDAITASGNEPHYLMDESGFLHSFGCVRTNGRKLREVSLSQAVAQELLIAPCCQRVIQGEAKLRIPRPRKANPSPMDVLGAMPANIQAEFNAWLMSLTKPKRQLVLEALPELDSEEELLGLLSLDPKIRLEMLPGLNEERIRIQQTLAGIGEALQNAAADGADIVHRVATGAGDVVSETATAVKDFDDSLKPTADKMGQEFRAATQTRKVSWSFWKIIGF